MNAGTVPKERRKTEGGKRKKMVGWFSFLPPSAFRLPSFPYGSAYRPTHRTPSLLISITSTLTGHAVARSAASTIGA